MADGGAIFDAYAHERKEPAPELDRRESDDFVGGQTKFALDGREAFAVAPKKGSVLCFLHGHHPLSPLHEGGLVTEGTKYVARTDVLYEMPPPP